MRPSNILLAALLISASGFASDEQTGKLKVYVATSEAWQMTGSGGAGPEGGGGAFGGGSRPQTVEVMKTFLERCPEVTITAKRESADYIVQFDREGGKSFILKDSKIAVFRADGDLVATKSTRSLGNAVKEACAVILGRPVK
jgi:hypothetical protein